jgi:hypothetical protein
MARRKNASYTGKPLHSGGTRALVDAFYNNIGRYFPGNEPVPIPPPESVRPMHDAQTQALIFADYAVRKFAPILFEAAGNKTEATKLRKLPKIVDVATATKAIEADVDHNLADDAITYAIGYSHGGFVRSPDPQRAAHAAAGVAIEAARFNPDDAWAAVTEMLAAL